MFAKELYPTTKELIAKLLKPYKYDSEISHNSFMGNYNISGSVLDPSAGTGNILDFLNDNVKRNIELFGIEINSELRQVLRSKDYQVIDSDFLNFNDDEYFDFILMNPPFSNGADHLLKAIEISRDTKIACILNAETIKNPYTEKRKKLLSIINQFGTYEFVSGGFKDAERKTDVEVALIWLDIKKEDTRFDFDFIRMDEIKVDFDFDFKNNSIAKDDMIGNLKLRYSEVQKAYEEKLKADQKYNYYLNAFLDGEGYTVKGDIEKRQGTPQQKFSYLSRKLKRFMWNHTINQLDLKKYMSSNVLKNFEHFISEQSNMAFNKENVYNFFDFILNNRVTIIENAIVEVFEDLTSHGYKENRMFVEMWKTNDAYKINRKIIAPAYVTYGEYMNNESLKTYGDNFSLGYSSWSSSKLSDLDKVLMYISGKKDDEILTIKEALENQFIKIGKIKTGQKFVSDCQSTFFDIKFYKKGTIHLKFRDKELWKEFNYRACNGKNWLPNDEKKKWKKSKNKDKPKKKEIFKNQLLELFA